jgi:regulator of RNase E activity RraA
VGKVFYVYSYNDSNWELHEQVKNVPEGSVVVVETHGIKDRAVFGHLVSKYIVLYCGAEAIVVNGYMRDAHRIIKDNFPVWCAGVTPLGCYNVKNQKPVPASFLKKLKENYEGTIAVCDDSGCVIISRDYMNEAFLNKLDLIELQEDIWYFCIDTKKWDTYKTVCMKDYLKNNAEIPVEYRKKLLEYQKDKI